MYQINKSANNVTKLKQCLFSELGFKERENLQEWIAKNPEILGEDLLIIQKEFDGFNDTNERLDLLALDKDGNLVIIENKLDDTGRDVVWQALKYTSYCSTLTTEQVIKMFQEYLDRYENVEDDAKSIILDFLGRDEDTLILNQDDQRIVFVANHYRKEVTSTVIWLLNHDIQIQCFKATPHSINDELFLQIDQIIPQPEIEEFMIDAKEKEKEVKGKSKVVAQTEKELVEFWQLVKNELQKNHIHYFDNISAKPYSDFGFSKGKATFSMGTGKYVPRVEIYFADDGDKKLFDAIAVYKNEIESKFHGEITWERIEERIASRIKHDMPKELFQEMSGWIDPEDMQNRVEWYVKEMVEFYNVLYPVWEKVQKELK